MDTNNDGQNSDDCNRSDYPYYLFVSNCLDAAETPCGEIMDWPQFRGLILDNLTDDLLTKEYRQLKEKIPNLPASTGHCYVASEAAYYMLGGKEEGWTPQFIRHLGCSHWFLKHKSGFILDLTYNQFRSPIDYSKARGTGFLTKNPSKRAKKLLIRIKESKSWNKIKGKL